MTNADQITAAAAMPAWSTKGKRYNHRAHFACTLPKLKLCVWAWKPGHGIPGDRWHLYVERVNTHCHGGHATEQAVKHAAIDLARRLAKESLAACEDPGEIAAWGRTCVGLDRLEEITLFAGAA